MKRLILFLLLCQPAWAAVVGTNLTSGEDTVDRSSYPTGSISPGANNLIILSVRASSNSATDDDTPIVSGNGLTWVQIDTQPYSSVSTSFSRLTVFRAIGASPTTGVVTIDFEGVVMTAVRWTVDQFTGIDTSGTNGSGAVGTPCKNAGESLTSLSCTLGAFSSGSGAYAGVAVTGGIDIVPEAGWTEVSSPNSLSVLWRATSDTTPSATFASSDVAIIAFEIKIPAAAASRPVLEILGVD